jgi:hypothetical protein
MGRRYFLWTSLLLLALTLVGFGDNLFTDVGQPSNSDPKFIVHGLFCLAWMLALVAQAGLIATGRVRVHRRVGIAAAIVAVGIVLSTAYVFWTIWTDWARMSTEVRANRLLLPGFALAVALGYRSRHRPDRHKRLMLVGSFCMMGPVLARSFDPLLVPFLVGWPESRIDAAFVPWMLFMWTGLFLSLVVHDLWREGRVHPVSGWGFLLFGAVWPVVLLH